MSRRKSGSPLLLFLIVLIVVVFLVVQRSHEPYRASSRPHSPPHAAAKPHLYRDESRSHGEKTDHSRESTTCETLGVKCSSSYFQQWQAPGENACKTQLRNGYPVPDPRCTPGGINTAVTVEVMRNPAWRTACIRNCQESEAEKHVTYKWYGLQKPRSNSGKNQVCELDHLVPLELGGADGLGNIWPECGPDRTVLDNRYFKIKDRVENYLADEVKDGRMSLDAAQQGIASDWTQFLADANRYCQQKGRC